MSFVKRRAAGKNRALLEIEGVHEIINSYGDLTKKPLQSLMRSAIHDIARGAANEAKKDAPVKSEITYFTPKGKEKTVKGNLKKAIVAKRRRPRLLRYGHEYRSDVVVTHGRKARFDAFYWFWVEYGFRNTLSGEHVEGQNFIEPAKKRARLNFATLLDQAVTKRIEKMFQKAGGFK